MKKFISFSFFFVILFHVTSQLYFVEQQSLSQAQSSSYGSLIVGNGNHLLISASGENTDTGAIYLYKNVEGVYSLVDRLNNSFSEPGDNFGCSAVIQGNTIIVGANLVNNEQGAVYVYNFVGSTWTVTQKLVQPGSLFETLFGTSIAMDGNMIAIGSPGHDGDNGAVFVFNYNGSSWNLQAQIYNPFSSGVSASFGTSLVLFNDTLVVGAPCYSFSTYSGFTGYYSLVGNTWNFVQTLPNDAAPRATFGSKLSSDGVTLVVSAISDTIGTFENMGSVFVYVKNGSNWALQAKLLPPNNAPNLYFGGATSVFQDTLVVIQLSNTYVFSRSGTTWSLVQTITSPGNSLSFGGDILLDGFYLYISDLFYNSVGIVYMYVDVILPPQTTVSQTSSLQTTNLQTTQLQTTISQTSTFQTTNLQTTNAQTTQTQSTEMQITTKSSAINYGSRNIPQAFLLFFLLFFFAFLSL